MITSLEPVSHLIFFYFKTRSEITERDVLFSVFEVLINEISLCYCIRHVIMLDGNAGISIP